MASVHQENIEIQQIFLAQMDQLLLPAYFLTGSHEEAADCFLEAWEACNEQQPPMSRFALRVAKRAVVKAAIRKIAADVAMSAAKHDEGAGTAITAGGYEESQTSLIAATFRHAVTAMNAFHRAALVLRLYEGYSCADVALLLGVSRHALDDALHQALICLMERLNLISTGSPVIVGHANGARKARPLEAAKVSA